MTRFWDWAVNGDSMAASYAFAAVILGGTFSGIVAFVTVLTAVVR